MLESEGLEVLTPLADHITGLDGDHTRIEVPARAGDLAPIAHDLQLPPEWQTPARSPYAFGRVFVLDLKSDCHQACSFCSTRAKFSPQRTFTAAGDQGHIDAMRAAREAGYDVLRLSGLDPLTKHS